MSGIVGPLLAYAVGTGLYVDIACWSSLCVMSFVMALHLHRLNKKQERRRIAAGWIGKLVDTSILTVKEAAETQKRVSGEKGEVKDLPVTQTEDMTDMENVDFHYVSLHCLING
jgi:hypothetical protein